MNKRRISTLKSRPLHRLLRSFAWLSAVALFAITPSIFAGGGPLTSEINGQAFTDVDGNGAYVGGTDQDLEGVTIDLYVDMDDDAGR
jgi:hypothetical protein